MSVQIQILNGKRKGAVFDISLPGEHVVGQRETAPIRLDDPWVSWDHCRIFYSDNEIWIEDLASTNGTYVNCQRIKRERLKTKDIIFFGKTHALFLVNNGTEASDFQRGLDRVADTNRVFRRGAPASTFGAPLGDSSRRELDSDSQRRSDPFSSGDDLGMFDDNDSSADLFMSDEGPISDKTRFDAQASRRDAGASGYYAATGGMGNPLRDTSFHSEVRGSFDARSSKASVNEIEALLDADGLDDLDALLAPGTPGALGAETDLFAPLPTLPNLPPLGPGLAPAQSPGAPSFGSLNPRAAGSPRRLGLGPGSTAGLPVQQGLVDLSASADYLDAPPPSAFPDASSLLSQPLPDSVVPNASTLDLPAATYQDGGDLSGLSKEALLRRLTTMTSENLRLKAAFQAARTDGDVLAAARVLRDQELNRLTGQLAELRVQFSGLQEELEEQVLELDRITEEMIEKEDTIAELQDQVQSEPPSLSTAPPRRGPPSASEDDLFLSDSGDSYL